MTDTLVQGLASLLGGKVSGEAIIFIISMIPILELRGGLLAASPALLNVPILKAIPICIIGNLLPIPFILLLIEKVLNGMERVPGLSKVAIWVRQKADKNKSQIEKFGFWGLVLFVGIPLPGTAPGPLPGRSPAPHEIRQSHWRDSLRNRHGHRDHVPFILRTTWRTLRLVVQKSSRTCFRRPGAFFLLQHKSFHPELTRSRPPRRTGDSHERFILISSRTITRCRHRTA